MEVDSVSGKPMWIELHSWNKTQRSGIITVVELTYMTKFIEKKFDV
jgi:hypothetical protein